MQILTISLNKELAEQLSCHKEHSFYHSQSMADACDKIEHEEFNLILKRTNSKSTGNTKSTENESITKLLGLTPISTKILLFGKHVDSPCLHAWRELGIDFILDPSVPEIIQQIQTNEP